MFAASHKPSLMYVIYVWNFEMAFWNCVFLGHSSVGEGILVKGLEDERSWIGQMLRNQIQVP